ncbi:hypothetical protein B6U83_02410 [Thermoplasmatales archaeon ex4484_36]|nr:MAG: hypothetical protein B6U83_02410 [Thermoplasmatales archaeon ex4484_36]RLF58614.1 MAG: hypothetical protein DRN37_04815 [Thermoplasmata archaeon]RLF70058.1 MAG: hypothetical protein DRN40_05475 [Thermoplasmata archaeon]
MAVVEIEDLHKTYITGSEKVHVLKGLNLKVEQGRMIMVMGPSGSGKTTLLNLIGGIDTDYSGKITVDGTDLKKLDAKRLSLYRREKVGFIFQFYNLIPTLTALENVELCMEALKMTKEEIRSRATEFLDLVGLSEKANGFPQELSAGEQQRVAIARALAKHPTIILADEPTGNLDEDREKNVMGIMRNLSRELGMTFIIVSHNPRLKKFVDQTLYLRHGVLHEKESEE